jgi:hypothetical protein
MSSREIKNKRTRKKTCEIDSKEKLRISGKDLIKSSVNQELSKKTNDIKEKDENGEKDSSVDNSGNVNQTQVSFGGINITIKKSTNTMSTEELRKYYDQRFNIQESEKTAKFMIQDDVNEVYEPIMEDNSKNSGSNSNGSKTNKISLRNKKVDRSNVHIKKVLSRYITELEKTDEWPKSTDILCWWCSHTFNSVPVPCPTSYDSVRNRYKIIGLFCSWSCSAAYSIEHYSSLSLVYKLKNEFCDHDKVAGDDSIFIAPPKSVLKNFGGYMNIKDYRNLDKSNVKFLISTEYMSYINQDIIELRS